MVLKDLRCACKNASFSATRTGSATCALHPRITRNLLHTPIPKKEKKTLLFQDRHTHVRFGHRQKLKHREGVALYPNLKTKLKNSSTDHRYGRSNFQWFPLMKIHHFNIIVVVLSFEICHVLLGNCRDCSNPSR